MNIQYASDLHLEIHKKIPSDLIVPSAPYLALVGDIGNPYSEIYRQVLSYVAPKFEKVFVLAGNHEFYGNYHKDTKCQIRRVVAGFSNIIFLDNEKYDLGTFSIIGSTLWSDITAHASRYINDYYMIKMGYGTYVSREDIIGWHQDAVQFIETEIHSSEKPLCVLTHHAPHTSMNGSYSGNELQSAFATDLSRLFKEPVVEWISGHTHQNIETEVNSIPLVANCYGYNNDEITTYKNDKVLSLFKA